MLLATKEKFKSLMIDRAARRLAVLCVFFDLAAWALLFARLWPFIKNGRLIALHYNIYLNVNDVGPARFAFVGALFGTFIIIVNFWFAARLYVPSRANALVILAVTAFYELLVMLSAFFIILINISH
jgi:hypothetical protein